MIRLTIDSTKCMAEIKKDSFSAYGEPVAIDLNKFLYSFQIEQNFMSDIPVGYYKHVEVEDNIYLWQVFHNTNNIFAFNYRDGEPVNLYIPYIIFKWKLQSINQQYKIMNSKVAIAYNNPFEEENVDIYQFNFTNVWDDGRICWGSHGTQGTIIPNLRNLSSFTNTFLTESRNNDMQSWSTINESHKMPNDRGLFEIELLDRWIENRYVGSDYNDYWSARS